MLRTMTMCFIVWTYVFSYIVVDGKELRAEPTLRLEKPTYVLGESIRFWIGVKAGYTSIPEKYWNTCCLHITRPDGTRTKKAVPWPVDGMIDHGWTGGCGLDGEKVQTGKYTLAFEFAEKSTKPVKLIVKKLDAINDISAGFLFGKKGTVKQDEDIPVVLRLQNMTRYLVRFPVFGMTGTHISIRVSRENPPMRSDFFYPHQELPGSAVKTSVDIYDWASLERVPFVTVKPGEKFELQLSLEDACQFLGPGKYEVTFSTAIPLLLGDARGKFADACPIRLLVYSREVFIITDESVREKGEGD